MNYDLRRVSLQEASALIATEHGYGGAGSLAAYAFGVFEDARLVAAYVWQPPAPGAARDVCPEAPYGVLALSRMVAVPKDKRQLKHISKPLMRQMKVLIDRVRWPVLITYSDEGQGHTGHVYRCSGWTPTKRSRRPVYESDGIRRSPYCSGGKAPDNVVRVGTTIVQRWEHWICDRGQAEAWIATRYERVRVPGRTWRSGAPAHTLRRRTGCGGGDSLAPANRSGECPVSLETMAQAPSQGVLW